MCALYSRLRPAAQRTYKEVFMCPRGGVPSLSRGFSGKPGRAYDAGCGCLGGGLMRLWFLVIAGVLGAAPGASAQVRCEISRVMFCDGCVAEQRWTVPKNGTCRSGSNFGAGHKGVTITAKPKHGRALTSAAGGWAYQPNPNYAGPDSFTVRVEFYNNMLNTLVSTVNVRVDVR